MSKEELKNKKKPAATPAREGVLNFMVSAPDHYTAVYLGMLNDNIMEVKRKRPRSMVYEIKHVMLDDLIAFQAPGITSLADLEEGMEVELFVYNGDPISLIEAKGERIISEDFVGVKTGAKNLLVRHEFASFTGKDSKDEE